MITDYSYAAMLIIDAVAANWKAAAEQFATPHLGN